MQDMASLPALPPHAAYWQAPAKGCSFDWGLVSEAIRAGKADKARYQFFILLTSATRGPFVPPYQLVCCFLRCRTCLELSVIRWPGMGCCAQSQAALS